MADPKRRALEAIERESAALRDLSSEIWSHPELAFHERHAHALLTRFLETRGFEVEREFTLETAFRARWGKRGDGGANVAVLCEYDALPGIGHACGHNLIAEAGVAAGLGLQKAIQLCPQLQNSCVTVLGCPAEEGEGGKIKMIENGCFDGIDCALMVHPFTESSVVINALARSYHRIVYTTPSHHHLSASIPPNMTPIHSSSQSSDCSVLSNLTAPPTLLNSDPNPLDAAVLAYMSLSMLRQQLNPSWMIHTIISRGGVHPVVKPTTSEILCYFRAPSYSELCTLQERGRACFKSAAMATGCTVSITEKAETYKDVVSNPTLVSLFLENSAKLGLKFSKSTQNFSASTDMGNVSHIVPSIHPVYGIDTLAGLHTRDFAKSTNTATAHRSSLQAAQAMALTAVDVLMHPHLLTQVKKDFSASQNFSNCPQTLRKPVKIS